MSEIIIKTSLSNIKIGTIYDNNRLYNHQKLKILFSSMIATIDYEKEINIQANCDLKGHLISFIMKEGITVNTHDKEKDIKIIRTPTAELKLENIKQLNPNFIDIVSLDKNGFPCFTI